MDWVEVEGPITTEATRKKRFGILPNNEEDIEEISECLQAPTFINFFLKL